MCHRPCSSADRATASGAVGRGFEPRQGHCGMPGEPPASRPAAIAQTAERTPRKRQVAGSCPARGSNGSRAPSGAGPSLPLAPSRTASLSLTAGPTFAGMGRAIRFSSGPSPSGRAPRSQRGGRGFESRRLHHAQRIEVGTQSYGRVPDARNTQTNGRPPPGRARGRGGDAPMARRRRACGSGPNPGGGAQEDWRNPHPPRQFAKRQGLARCARTAKHRHGWWAVRQRRSPAKTVGAEVPGEFDSRTIRLPICSDRPRDRAFGIQSAKRVDRQWPNAVGHTCPAHSRTFPHGVTAAHGSLEPLVLVRNQVRERFRRLLQTDWKRPAKPWERVRLPYSPLSGSNIRFDFFLYTRHDSCTGHTGNQASPKPRKRRHALVAQWIERPSPERKVTSPILVEGTHETPPIIMRGVIPLLFSLTPSRLVRLVHHEATPL